MFGVSIFSNYEKVRLKGKMHTMVDAGIRHRGAKFPIGIHLRTTDKKIKTYLNQM